MTSRDAHCPPEAPRHSALSQGGVVMWVALVVCLVVSRFWFLDARPVHFDEGVNGWWVQQIQAAGYYPFQGQLFHGPLVFYLMFIAQRLFGDSLTSLRLVAALSGCLAGGAFLGFCRWLSPASLLVALALFVVSPALLYYSRDAIHEPVLMAFAVVTAVGLNRILLKPEVAKLDLILVLVGVTGLLLTKETCWVLLASMVVSTIGAYGFQAARDKTTFVFSSPSARPWLLGAAVILLLVYSGLGAYPTGLKEWLLSPLLWLQVGLADPVHIKTWWYYGFLLGRYETLLLLGFIASAWPLWLQPDRAITANEASHKLMRWLWLYAAMVLLLMSAVPYKTPWNTIQWLWPMALLSGYWGVLVWNKLKQIMPAWASFSSWLLLLAAFGLWFAQGVVSWNLATVNSTNPNHAYVYGQCYSNVAKLPGQIQAHLQQVAGSTWPYQTILVFLPGSSPWPLPWVLRDFADVRFLRTTGSLPETLTEPVILTKSTYLKQVFERMPQAIVSYQAVRLRPGEEDNVLLLQGARPTGETPHEQ